MCNAWALISILLRILGAPIPLAIAAFLAVSLPAANDIVDQLKSISAVPYVPAPTFSSTPYTAPGDSITLESLNSSQSLPHHQNLTVDVRFPPGSEIDLIFTAFGGRLSFTTAWEIMNQAIHIISANLMLHPTECITGGVFQQRHEGLSLRVHQYLGKDITWFSLNHILLCLQEYLTTQPQRLRDMQFEIDVDESRVGYGSLWSIGLSKGNDVAKRDIDKKSQPLQMLSTSRPGAQIESNHSLLLPVPNESQIIFSYHFYGPEIPESLIEACFDLARQSIRTHVQTHPQDELPGSSFRYSADGSDVSIEIHAFADREISWLLLDNLLREINADLIDERHLYACEIEFEIPPLKIPYGYGSLVYDPPDILPDNRSQVTASGVKRVSLRLRDANESSNNPPGATTAILNPTSE